MKQTASVSLAILGALFVAGCGDTGGRPETTAERNEVTDSFLAPDPLASSYLPPADSPTSP